jgi:AAA+ superfamily predicted ATPase
MSLPSGPTNDNATFLEGLCRYADLLIDRAVSRREAAAAAAATSPLAERQRALRDQHALALETEVTATWQALEAIMQGLLGSDSFVPWVHLAQMLQLGSLEQQMMLVALLPDLDGAYRGVLTELAGSETVADPWLPLSALSVLLDDPSATPSALLADSSLRRWNVLELEPHADVLRLRGGFRLDEALGAYLCARAVPQLRLYETVRELNPVATLDELSLDPAVREQAHRFVEHCGADAPEDASFVLQLQGPDTLMLEQLCAAIFSPLRMACAELDGAQLAAHVGDGRTAVLERVRLLCRNAMLCNRVLVLTQCQRLSGDAVDEETRGLFAAVFDTLLESQRYVAAINPPARLLSERAHRYAAHPVMPVLIQLSMPDAAGRRRAWQQGAARHDLALPDELLDRLAGTYLFTETQIESALKELESRRLLDSASPLDRLLLDVCRDASVSEQFSVAEEVKTRYRLEDIVLPAPTRAWLEELLQYARNRHQVIEQWGFDSHQANSRNLCVLFYGPSGTGKTMAASVIANELNLGLYRVDLSSVLSKYIGETEKHLARLFDQAESGNVVLCFDEAESLFAKRTEMHDAHDRYANLQTGYLLQRIETYPGIVVLSTNMLGNIDKAFTRRFKFIIEYPFPGAEQRRELWRKAFPADAPRAADVDLNLLAERAPLSGGNIGNIVLRAAFYAAGGGHAIGMADLLKAVEREYDKLGKVFAPGDFMWGEDD